MTQRGDSVGGVSAFLWREPFGRVGGAARRQAAVWGVRGPLQWVGEGRRAASGFRLRVRLPLLTRPHARACSVRPEPRWPAVLRVRSEQPAEERRWRTSGGRP